MTVFDNRGQFLLRALLGGLIGTALFLLLAWFTQPGWLFLPSLAWDFTFCYNSNVPELLGAALGFLLWFLFGAEAGVATLPFADGGRQLLLRSLAHFGAMALTLWAWVVLNFPHEPLPSLALTFLLPFTLVYLLIWLGRWVGWYAEVAQIRERLGLTGKPSFLKWRETLPHILFAAFLCFLLPLLLTLFDPPYVPVLTAILYAWLLLPVGCFFSALSLGRRQGICPLYPLACGALSALLFHAGDLQLPLMALSLSLAGNLLGAGMRARRRRS